MAGEDRAVRRARARPTVIGPRPARTTPYTRVVPEIDDQRLVLLVSDAAGRDLRAGIVTALDRTDVPFRMAVVGCDDPFTGLGEVAARMSDLLRRSDRPTSWQQLERRFSAELLEFALATGLLIPHWARTLHTSPVRPSVTATADGPRCAYVVEGGFQHAFPVQALSAC